MERLAKLILFTAVVILSASTALADGMIIIDPPHHPLPIPRPHYTFAPLEVRYHHVTVNIKDQMAVTEVDQAFYNPGGQRLEGTYIFPIPKNAQIQKFSMDIGGKMMEAEMLDAAKARQIYEDIVRRMKDPALLEYMNQGMLKLRIFPIEPYSEKKIKLRYEQLLQQDAGTVQYLYPLNTEKFSSQPLKSVSVKVNIEAERPLKTIYSPSHSIEVKREGERRAVAGYEASNVKPDTDFQLFFAADRAEEPTLRVLSYRKSSEDQDGYFLLLASPPSKKPGAPGLPKDVVFVLDTSGSMTEGGKLEQAKKALRFCLRNLNRADRFELIRFSTEAEPAFNALVEASESSINKAEEIIAGYKAIGGTAIEDALAAAMKIRSESARAERPYFVVFLTDGLPTVGATNEEELLKKVADASSGGAVRVFSFGVGTDVNTRLLDGLAEKTKAASQYVMPNEDLEIKLSNFYAKISEPVLTDLKLSFTGVTASKMYPQTLPDLFAGEQLTVIGRYRGTGEAEVALSGHAGSDERSYSNRVVFPENADDNGFVRQLWATRRVGFLLDEIRLRGSNKELVDEVSELARKFGIVTPYTAYLIVEDEAQRNVPISRRTVQFDAPGKQQASDMWRDGRSEASGARAVGAAQAFDRMKSSANIAAPAEANSMLYEAEEAKGAGMGGKIEKALAAQQMKIVKGRAFYQNGSQWIDGTAEAVKNKRRVQVKFNSEEYFTLLRSRPDAAPWFAVGRNAVVALDDAVYEVTE